jgi:hypothetical protein
MIEPEHGGPFRTWMFQLIIEAINRKILPEEALLELAFVRVAQPEPPGTYLSKSRIFRVPLVDV